MNQLAGWTLAQWAHVLTTHPTPTDPNEIAATQARYKATRYHQAPPPAATAAGRPPARNWPAAVALFENMSGWL